MLSAVSVVTVAAMETVLLVASVLVVLPKDAQEHPRDLKGPPKTP